MGKIHITRGNYNAETDELIDYADIVETGDAYSTSRVLDGSSDHGYAQEWAAPCRLPDGRTGHAMYLFDEDDLSIDGEAIEQAEDYPWDEGHLRRVVLSPNS